MQPNDLCQILPWDSEFFGRKIGRLTRARLEPASVPRVLDWCRTNQIECLYFLADASDYETTRVASEGGFTLVDVRITLATVVHQTNTEAPKCRHKIRPSQASDLAQLKVMAGKLHRDSRFFFDPHFSSARARAMYETWIEKCCRDSDGIVLVAEQDGNPAGYIACTLKPNNIGQIELVGVDGPAQGKGLGQALITAALQWFAKNNAQHIFVATQGRNLVAQRLYEKCGFHIELLQLWFHRWFKKETPDHMSTGTIPFNKPCLAGQELAAIAKAIENGWISADGAYTKKCQQKLEELLGVPHVLLTTSCTDALEMVGLLLDLQPGEEVIVPSFTFVSTANAFARFGAKPVFIDIRRDTLNLDESQIERLVSPRTRAIVPVHYAGVACEMDALMTQAQRQGISVIEDNAHGLLGRYRGRNLGTFGRLAALSFHETKNISCGEGGAIIVNDPSLAERAEIIRSKGTNRSLFFRGQVDKYTWVDFGSSFSPSDLLAAYLFAQLESAEKIQAKRRRVWEYYQHHLQDWAREKGVGLPFVPSHCEQAYHMFYLLLPSLKHRQSLIENLKARGIMSVFHYVPLHLSPMGRKFGGKPGDCPVTEDVSDRLVRLPFYNDLTEADQDRVVQAIKEVGGI